MVVVVAGSSWSWGRGVVVVVGVVGVVVARVAADGPFVSRERGSSSALGAVLLSDYD
ncbi:hypothetical protein [Subtercola sp. YIM 133946]|uniref:hypothetical protein n=1 Tax=Subtercola sp. YIM 133946 TaxID=3118909 RepID=UPI002F94B828